MMPKSGLLTALLTLLATLAPTPTLAEEPAPVLNRAQELVFMGEHLRQTHQGQQLVYDFRRHATGEPDKTDEVLMTVTRVRDEARRDLAFEFLSGADRLDFPDAQGYRGNPIAVQFLERDIREMAKRTGTPIAHFRNRIRRSFSTPQISETRITVGDKLVDATEITVTPFSQDPGIAKLDGYAGKEYLFVYSDRVPGDLFRIRTRMSGADGVALEEELRFKRSSDAL